MTEQYADKLEEAVELIEASYEFMLAYAAQGRETEGTVGAEGLSIRDFLTDMEKGLKELNNALSEKFAALQLPQEALQALENFRNRIAQDADAALLAVKMVQTVPSISSQLIDNLNASVHLRCLLTDMFVIDEALKIYQRAPARE